MNTDNFISRLDGVRQTGEFKWRARCPAHQSNSLSLAVASDGEKILLYCFSGCSPDEICSAVGLSVADLFPRRDSRSQFGWKQAGMAADILYQSLDLMMMSILASSDLADGKRLDPKAREKLINGAGRLSTALETFGIRRKAK